MIALPDKSRARNTLGLLICCYATFCGMRAAPNASSPKSGELLLVPFASAAFPHPERSNGHKYKDQFFSAQEHYSDNTVGIFIPRNFRETGSIDFVIHFHGWKNHVAEVLRQYELAEQLIESGRNAILVVPQGPRDASDSFGGKLEDPDGFKRFVAELIATLREKSGLTNKEFSLGRIILSGHSGGYQVISSILDHGGLTDHIKEVWLFDGLYARTEKFIAWSNKGSGRFTNLYTDNGGTKAETERMMATLKEGGSRFLAANDSEIGLPELRTNKLVFLHTQLGHNDVLNKGRAFRDFLSTSFLAPLRQDAER